MPAINSDSFGCIPSQIFAPALRPFRAGARVALQSDYHCRELSAILKKHILSQYIYIRQKFRQNRLAYHIRIAKIPSRSRIASGDAIIGGSACGRRPQPPMMNN